MPKKTGRNDPCPCGSGKKYKHCCWAKDKGILKGKSTSAYEEHTVSRLALMRFEQDLIEDPEGLDEIARAIKDKGQGESFREFIVKSWNIQKVRKMSTQEIIGKLGSMNVKFDPETFKKQAQDYVSAIQLAEDHYYTQDYYALNKDEDFIWLAITELWNRYTPGVINVEMIDDSMQEGYKGLKNRDYEQGIEKWEKAWSMIKSIAPTRIKSVEDADEYVPHLTQSIFNWCQDLEMELGNAGVEDESYYARRIKYCRDFCRTFPQSDETIILNMLAAEADSYAALGDAETADKLYKEIIERFPDNAWAYIGWGDLYCVPLSSKTPTDYDKAEKIYHLGLTMCLEDLDIIEDRLMDLEDDRRKET